MSIEKVALEQELKTYEEHKEQLLREAGKFVLVSGSEVMGVWDTYEDALKVGYQRCGVDKRFLVKKIEGLERVQFFSRDVACQASPPTCTPMAQ